ncbi:MAG: hypothetical protein GY710_16300 [Desulfobacteraceae bacterium]|nr:hypothetical protein [Desulfobacteraceae bacterium]
MKKKNYKILPQGIFDSHCLQYAIMNAFKALSEPASSSCAFATKAETKWQKIIAITPSLQNFSAGWGSDFRISTLVAADKIIDNLVRSYFEVISEKTKFNYSVSKIQISQMKSVNFTDSVLIFSLKNKAKTEYYDSADHWVCAIGIDENSFLLACSWVLYERGTEYSEQISDMGDGRYFNNKLDFSEINNITIYGNQIYIITKA